MLLLLQTWDAASQAAWDAWMSARSYAGGSWKDAQRAAQRYWSETMGALNTAGLGGLGGLKYSAGASVKALVPSTPPAWNS